MIQEDVRFRQLGLVVIDEQHKFGVRQRATLKQAGIDPHYLVMTATPIPRTRDHDAVRRPGRLHAPRQPAGPAEGAHLPGRRRPSAPRWWEFFRSKLREGRQGYVVVPLVEESEQLAAASLDATYEALANGPLEAFRLGLIHGRMSCRRERRRDGRLPLAARSRSWSAPRWSRWASTCPTPR